MSASSLSHLQCGDESQGPASVFEEGEGLYSESARAGTRELLLPAGRPGPWLLALGTVCVFVVMQAVLGRLA